MARDEWCCGDRLFFSAWITPFGHTRDVMRVLRDEVFPEVKVASSFRRYADTSVRRVNRWHLRPAPRRHTSGGVEVDRTD